MERRRVGVAAAVLVAAALAGVGISRIGPAGGSSSSGTSGPAPAALGKAAPAPAGGGAGIVASVSRTPAIGPDVIRTADVTLGVGSSRLRSRLDAVGAVAQRFDGYVASSGIGDLGGRSGQAVVRVPSSRFQPALAAIDHLGTVRAESISGRDVTSQVIDLHARLINAQAQRQVLLRLMSRATTIGGSIAVENQLQAVELTIEQLQGDLRELANQTSLATIAVELVPVGAPHPKPAGTLGGSLGRSLRAAEAVVAAVVVGLGYLLPLAAIALVIYGCWRGLRAAFTRRPATGGPPAGEAQ